ncbi:MAG: sensor histidine kinase [Desulfovibrionaceae bacterium]
MNEHGYPETGEMTVRQSMRYAEDLAALHVLEKQRRRELEQTNERLSSVLESMGEGVAALGVDGSVSMANQRFRALMCSGGAILDAPACEVVDLEGFQDFLDGVDGGYGESSADFVSPRLGDRQLRVQANRMKDGGLVLVVRDITAETRAAGLKQEFLALVSHELRTPLNGLLGFLQLLEMDGGQGVDEEVLGHLRLSADRLHGSVDELLKLTDLRALELEKPRELACVRDVVDAAVRDLAGLARTRGVEVEVAMGCPEAMVFGRPTLLREMVRHLARNAIQHSRRGGRVHLRSECGEGRVRLVVEDQGSGIPAPELERVFESFYQVQGYMRRSQEGLGLGLTLARRIARLHGGEVRLESLLGVGARCEVELEQSGSLLDAGGGDG